MPTHPAGTASLAASLTGCVTLLCDVATLVGRSGRDVGFRTAGPGSRHRQRPGLPARPRLKSKQRPWAAGLHLSWIPITVVLLFPGAYRPQTAAMLLRSLAGPVLDVFAGLADLITTLWT
jgi:hypothetical protein